MNTVKYGEIRNLNLCAMDDKRTDKGTFLPGNIGKPKGALNKISAERKEKIELILNLADDMVEEALLKLKPKELLDVWMGLNEFLTPKLQRVTLDAAPEDNKITKITFEVVPAGKPSE